MTCIVGVVNLDGSVTMGGDSAGSTASGHVVPRKDAKVFRNGDFLIGIAGSFRMGDILRYSFQPPERDEDESLEKYMATKFIDGVREVFKEKGFLRKDDQVESMDGDFLVAVDGRLFEVDVDYQVGEVALPYNAIGSGHTYAKGSLHATAGLDLSPRKRVRQALKAAVEFNAYVRPPFVVHDLPAPSKP